MTILIEMHDADKSTLITVQPIITTTTRRQQPHQSLACEIGLVIIVLLVLFAMVSVQIYGSTVDNWKTNVTYEYGME
jgi:hypothetical protein